jgi:hypothetical protein
MNTEHGFEVIITSGRLEELLKTILGHAINDVSFDNETTDEIEYTLNELQRATTK